MWKLDFEHGHVRPRFQVSKQQHFQIDLDNEISQLK